MTGEDISELLSSLGCEKIKQNNSGWINSSCPFAPFTALHKNRTDSSPSFGVHVNECGVSGYQCFTCNKSGTLNDLLFRLRSLMKERDEDVSVFQKLFEFVSKRENAFNSPEVLLEKLNRAEYVPKSMTEIGGIRISSKSARMMLGNGYNKPEVFLPEEELDVFTSLSEEAEEYLLSRGLKRETLLKWEFKWHPRTRRIAIPIRDLNRRLVGISGRSLYGENKRKFLHSSGFQRDRYLFGEVHVPNSGLDTAVVVEGFFDAIFLWQNGYAGLAIMGTYPSSLQVEKLSRMFKEVVILPDGDSAGEEAAKRVAKYLLGRIPVRIGPVFRGKDPDELSPLELSEAIDSAVLQKT